ncbi:hypothetical protein LC653_40055 [Nostoc sp. CHAB 5784]|uniref:hypothetical protein n=1 Tax=Nostoc mirabile TaxID=2907820 RepID=UPI001E5FECAE|nr:hypothetical protein [Nostoc mirabile]MCC5669838.1 hypothetical protein [Nostoc mirabile CHAB5784]
MPYLLLKTLISLHCGNPSSNVSYFEVLKAFLTSACGWRSLLEKMGNTLGKSGECCGVMLELENVEPLKFGQLIAAAPDWVQWMG